MDPHEFPGGDMPFAPHLHGDIGDERRVSYSPLGIETPLVCHRFPLLNFLHDVVYLCPLQGLVAIQFLFLRFL